MLENPKEKEFGCSEVNVFVRLASFCARLEKVGVSSDKLPMLSPTKLQIILPHQFKLSIC